MNRTFAQRITFALALLSFLAAVGCATGAFLYQQRAELDPIHASLMASVVFFAGVGTVLYVIASTRLRGLLALRTPGDSGER